ncbi:MAG: hypothetical protein L0Z53_08115 [Acidobacteriales bacterium]|nr:hypothetical protein [Terriglobales bacterium]
MIATLSPRDPYQRRVEELVRQFGRKNLVSRCDQEASTPAYLALVGAYGTSNELIKKSKRHKDLSASNRPVDEIVDEVFLAILSRYPNKSERQAVNKHLQSNPEKFFALLNTREFMERR